MLDQNTDRMWYVIGAVIIGAAIIFIMNNTFPQLFASIGETFTGKTEETTEMTDGISPNMRENIMSADDVTPLNTKSHSYNDATDTWDLEIMPWTSDQWYSAGLRVSSKNVVIPYGQRLTISYAVYIPADSELVYAKNDINNLPVDASVTKWSSNDGDKVIDRRFNGLAMENVLSHGAVAIPLTPGEWTNVSFSYTNRSDLNADNVNMYDYSSFGVFNDTGGPLKVQIRNVKGVLSTD